MQANTETQSPEAQAQVPVQPPVEANTPAQEPEAKAPTQVKPTKTAQQLKAEYEKLCAEAGNLQFSIEIQKAQLQQANIKLSQINKEYSVVAEQEVAEAKKKSLEQELAALKQTEQTTSTNSEAKS